MQKPQKYYACPICKLHYPEHEWAKKCQAWCSKHASCNLKIARHSLQESIGIGRATDPSAKGEILVEESENTRGNIGAKFLTGLFYFLIGLTASVGLFVLYDFLLTRTSSITTFYLNTKDTPFYMWYYVVSTALALVLFGVDAALTVYLFRRTRQVRIKDQGSNAAGTVIGAFAASCPVCSGLLLSIIGITGGLAAFPFKGLELKTLSVILLAIPLFFLIRRVKNPDCDGKCPAPRAAGFQKSDRLSLVSLLMFLFAELLPGYSLLKTEPVLADFFYPVPKSTASPVTVVSDAQLARQVQQEVLPPDGFQTSIVLGNVIPAMVANGIIDVQKLQDLYKDRGGIPKEEMDLLTKPSGRPLKITNQNQFWLVTFLWPLGLVNRMAINNQSPVAGKDLFNFASTGGWNLGRAQNGGSYFNKYTLIPLTPEQEQRVKTLAENTYRPCCNNSTFFQDCNHGSAALALIELGVAQNLSDQEIYRTVLHFNSFWFPQNYTEMGLYFKAIKHLDWNDVDPKLALSKDYSSISGWSQNVDAQVRQIPGLLPAQNGSGSCGT